MGPASPALPQPFHLLEQCTIATKQQVLWDKSLRLPLQGPVGKPSPLTVSKTPTGTPRYNEQGANDNTIRFDVAGTEVTSINSDTFNFGNINLNVKSTVPVPSVPKSTESYSSVNNTFSTLANISSWIPSSIGLRSLTVNPSTVNGGLHDFSASNTVSIGIVVSDSSIRFGNGLLDLFS